jgi:hypothetical protein
MNPLRLNIYTVVDSINCLINNNKNHVKKKRSRFLEKFKKDLKDLIDLCGGE